MSAKLINPTHTTSRLRRRYSAGFYLLTFAAGGAMAAQVDITARYVPETNNPTFENTTYNSGFCDIQPGKCTAGSYTLSIPNQTQFMALVKNLNVDIRVPRAWRELDVTHADGSSQKVRVRFTGLGATLNFSPDVLTITGYPNISNRPHEVIWGGSSFGTAPAGCSPGIGAYTATSYLFFWYFSSDNPCTKQSNYDVTPGIYFNYVNFMYELETPNPLAMSAGLYRGQLTYTIGPAGELVLGNAIATDSVLTLNFALSVLHTFRVDMPSKINLELAPPGGWDPQRVYNGASQLPDKLLAEQDYQQWTSTRFKMQLQCEYAVGDDCGLQNDEGNTNIAVTTSVTLPNGLQNSSNGPVDHYPLSNRVASAFQPTRYINNEHATLHFEVDKAGVKQMVNSGSRHFHGDVTVIWDSQV